MKVNFRINDIKFEGEFNDTRTAKEIYANLPLNSIANTWGDEIYFDIGLKLSKENPTLDVKIGDIAYWPQGSCMCIFFGPTPVSTNKNPKPASEVTIIGKTNTDIKLLRSVKDGDEIIVEKKL
ncbi:MAG: hypothetical protein FJZ16_06210 [Candidatus Omnitrophica bacterium]|nr:hypothetical protein [Candidatus Omnitrophota bacterium]